MLTHWKPKVSSRMYSVDSCATKIMFIVPDEILDTISCDFCHKILSVGPVRVYPNRKTKCGRCSEVGDSGIISQYELVAQHSLYKCVNRFDGCKKLLSYDDQVAEHEATCHSKTYDCPVCPQTTEIPTFLLVKHFTQEHAENFLKIPFFDIDTTTTSTRTYLYRVRNNLFFIESGCNSVYEITLNTFFLGDSKDAFRIKQKFTLKYGAGSKKIETISKRCDYLGTPNPGGYKLNKPGVDVISAVFELSLPEDEDLFILSRPDFNKKCSSTRSGNADDNSESLERKLKAALSRKITLGSGFQKDFSAHSVNYKSTALLITHNRILTVAPYCCNCSLPLPASSYYLEIKLKKYQPICVTCEECFRQISPEIRFINCSKLYTHSPYNHVTYSCIWNCKAVYHANEILQHEIICQNQQPQACPVQSCTYYSKLYDLEEHFKAIHPQDLISLTPIFHTEHKSIAEKWYVWVQFGFLSIKVSSEDGGHDRYNGQKTRWKIAVESILKGDVHVEPKCLAYHEDTYELITSTSNFVLPGTEIKFLCYFEMS